MFRLVHVLFILKVVISQTAKSDLQQFAELSWGTRIRQTYLQFAILSLTECARQCLRRKRCTSINYSKQLLFCELNYETNGTRLSQEDSDLFIHSNISGWSKNLIGTCKNHNCTNNEKCTVSGHCNISDCGPAPDPPANAVALGTGHHEVGNGFYFGCKGGYLMRVNNDTKIQGNVIPVQCLRTGQWEQPQLQCEEALMFDDHWYYVSTEPLSWFDAQIFCRSMNSHLVKVESKKEFQFINTIIVAKNKWVWTGGNDIAQEGTWVWEADNLQIKWQNWYIGEPSHMYEDCIILMPYVTGWFDYDCKQKTNFICEQ